MAIPHAQPGQIVDVRPLGSSSPGVDTARPRLADTQTHTLFRAEQVEVIRLVVPAGKEIHEHRAKGEITVHCLEGAVEFTAFGKTQHLAAGELLYLPTGEAHSVKGVKDSSILLTILLPKHA